MKAEDKQNGNFEEIRSNFYLKSRSSFEIYIYSLFDDQLSKTPFLSKGNVADFLKLPDIMSERMVQLIDINKLGQIKLEELIDFLSLLYFGTLEEVTYIIFQLYDTEGKGFVSTQNVKEMLAVLPLKENRSTDYKYQMNSYQEIDQIIAKTFGDKSKIYFEEFMSSVKKNPFIILYLVCYLYHKCPFKEENMNSVFHSDLALEGVKAENCHHFYSSGKSFNCFSNDIILMSPSINYLSPVLDFLGKSSDSPLTNPDFINEFSNKEILSKIKGSHSDKELGKRTKSNRNFREDVTLAKYYKDELKLQRSRKNNNCIMALNLDPTSINKRISSLNKEEIVKKDSSSGNNGYRNDNSSKIEKIVFRPRQKKVKTNILLLPKEEEEKIDVHANTFDNPKIKVNLLRDRYNSEDNIPVQKDGYSPAKSNFNKIIELENYVYFYKKETNTLISFWMVLIGEDIFYFDSINKDKLLKIHNLSGCFIIDNEKCRIFGKSYYNFSIIFEKKLRTYYFENKDEAKEWSERLKEVTGFRDIADFYDIVSDLGKGQYGKVKLGINKETKEKVAIKVIEKIKLKKNTQSFIQNEIEILRFLKHPNIVRFIDYFEEAKYAFLIMEFAKYGSLQNYFKLKKFSVPEPKVSSIAYQVVDALKYMHDYGIIHRDLKPDNIIISKMEENMEVKLMDFGFGKILGKKEMVDEGFGTLAFVAPEILLKEKYNKSVDVWSLGAMIFYLLTGTLPFGSMKQDRKSFKKSIVYGEFEFKEIDNYSYEVKDFIMGCLKKNVTERFTIEDLSNQKWILMHKK